MVTQLDYSSRLISPQEQTIYDHLLACVERETPDVLIERFRTLFIEGSGYSDHEVTAVLDQIVADKQVDTYFRHILNRCCHILINRWQNNRHCHAAIAELVGLFEQVEPEPTHTVRQRSRSRSARRLREVVAQFSDTEQYVMLQRLVRVIESSGRFATDSALTTPPLGNLIGRYPYLYQHCLLNKESPKEHQRHVRRIQSVAQHRFEVDLSHYVTYRMRRAQLRRRGCLESRAHHLRPASNPTLLSDRELVKSLRQFSGKVDAQHTYQDLAQRFVAQSCQSTSFKTFKDDLYEYVTASIDSEYGKRNFNHALHHQLVNIYPDSNQQKLNDFLLVRTCSQLFNFLVVDATASRQHFIFIDLINNVGPLTTTGILLKILLLCRKVRPYLERRFSVLFGHYEASSQEAVQIGRAARRERV
ncbi:MAG: hypothetical protein F6J97_06670 [Leptolyngbya sp. SIO4C1]|nr:hypothetical protein [Leptolyngbya sp. SIO4C1]